MPTFMTCALFLLLAPVMWKKESISQTLLQNGDLHFFGNPFPERLVLMHQLQKSPKLSAQRPAELLLQKNMLARLRNLGKKKFWMLWWKNFVYMKSLPFLTPLRLPIALIMVILHSFPIFSVWANFIRSMFIKITQENIFTEQREAQIHIRICKMIFHSFLFLLVCIGIVVVCLMFWLFLIIYCQVFVFLFIDILRNPSYTLPRCIVIFSIFIYIKMAFGNFEEDYRCLKEVVLDLCKSFSEEEEVVLIDPPYEPLYIKTWVSLNKMVLIGGARITFGEPQT